MEEAIVTKDDTKIETAPESSVKEEPDAIVEEAVVTQEATEADTAPDSPV